MLGNVIQHIDKVKYLVKANSPAILTGLGISGTIVTAYLTGRASFRAAAVLEHEKRLTRARYRIDHMSESTKGIEFTTKLEKDADEYIQQTLTRSAKARLVWRLYIPPTAACVSTVTCIFMANKISSTRVAALTTAAGISERALKEYKEKVIEKLGERQDQKIRDEVAQDRVNKFPPSTEVMIGSSGDVLFMDELTGRYFHSTVENVKRAENDMNRELLNGSGGVSLSEFHDELGLPPTKYTEEVGWNPTHKIATYFSTVMTPDKRPCIVMGFEDPPFPDYNNLWTS